MKKQASRKRCPKCKQLKSIAKPIDFEGRFIRTFNYCPDCYAASVAPTIELIKKLVAKKYFKIINGAVIVNRKKIVETYKKYRIGEPNNDYSDLKNVFRDLGILKAGYDIEWNQECYYVEVNGQNTDLFSIAGVWEMYYLDRGVAEQMLRAEKENTKGCTCRLLKVSVVKIM